MRTPIGSGVAIALLFALAGCGGSAAPTIDTVFTRIAPSGYIDLSLEFYNPTSKSVTLTGRLVASDKSGHPLPRVRVTTAFGTEKGQVLLLPGDNVDLVQLHGAGEAKVRHISLENADVNVLEGSQPSTWVRPFPLDAAGRYIHYPMLATRVRLTNKNPVPVRVRIVLMVLGSTVPQEATLVRDAGTVDLKAHETTEAKLDSRARSFLRKHGRTSFVVLRAVLAPSS